ncbi:MAG: hypothetical protein JW699_06090 [Chitinispirillaceae bacterium]|nr:hypothetical protein [Chitinispirillaceae bacterium]
MTDSIHWNVEVDLAQWPYGSGLPAYPCETDTFLLYCESYYYSTPPADSLRHPVIHEVFDSRGIAVLTPQHFPGMKFVKGSYVYLQMRFNSGGYYTWQAQIPGSITAQQSVVGSREQYCCEWGPTGCTMTCIRPGYSISNTPTIGLPNRFAAVSPEKNAAPIANAVRLLSPKIRGQIPVAVSGSYAGQGTFDVFSTNGSLVRSLTFDCRGPGTYTVVWDGFSGQGKPVPAGTYVCRVRLGEDVTCRGMVAW